MYLFLISVVPLFLFLATLLYRQNGKRKIFQIDLVQFIYLFVFMPVVFVWAKSFLFYLLNHEVSSTITARDAFVIDTAFSIVSFYIFSAVSIHTITKTLALHKKNDPDLDLFHMSEYFHLWWSHIFIFVGAMIASSFISTINIFIPMTTTENKFNLYITLIVGILFGILTFFAIWMADPKQQRRQFLRMMKLCLMFFSLYHVVLYFLIEPKFSVAYSAYWFMLVAFVSATISGFSFVRSRRAQRLHRHFTPTDWGKNIDLFSPKGPLAKRSK